jgi:hypothetical protein
VVYITNYLAQNIEGEYKLINSKGAIGVEHSMSGHPYPRVEDK